MIPLLLKIIQIIQRGIPSENNTTFTGSKIDKRLQEVSVLDPAVIVVTCHLIITHTLLYLETEIDT